MAYSTTSFGFRYMLTPVVKRLMIANVVVFFLTLLVGRGFMFDWFAFQPTEIFFRPWGVFTYMFLHADIYHIMFNLFALWIFGQAIENLWGSKRFLIYYLLTGIGAAIIHMFVGGYFTYTLGASGAVFGILLAFGMMFPDRYIMLLIPPIPVKAKYFVTFYGLFELFNGLSMPNSGVAHFAHLGGLAVGFVLIKYWGLKKPDYYG